MFSLRIHLLLHQAQYTVVNFVPYLRLTCTFRCQAQHISGTFTAPISCTFQQIDVQRRCEMLWKLSLGELRCTTCALQTVLHDPICGKVVALQRLFALPLICNPFCHPSVKYRIRQQFTRDDIMHHLPQMLTVRVYYTLLLRICP